MTLLRPRALAPGDRIAVAALSGPLDPGDEVTLARGVAMLEAMGFAVVVTPRVRGPRRWWAAASPGDQADELNTLLRDRTVRAIIAHCGGRATFGYLDAIDFDAIRRDPKPILGYSDITALHLAIHARTGLVGVHADMVTYGLGRDWFQLADPARRTALAALYTRLLTRAEPLGSLPAYEPWETWRDGRARGPLVGGLLSRLVRIQATQLALPPTAFDGAILFWEEVGVPLPNVWNDLHALRLAGILDRIAGMVIGKTVLAPPDVGVSLRDAVLDVVGERAIPILAHVDFGHASANLPMPIGITAALDADARTLALCEPVVA